MPRSYVLEHLQERSLGYRRRDDFMAPDFFAVKCGPTNVPLRPGTDANEQFCLEATLSVTFWANQAQFSRAREIAERALIHRLYADVLADLTELHLQINNGDRDACHKIVCNIESKLK
jgi:hypothetical protein